jgi:hypothetical protein
MHRQNQKPHNVAGNNSQKQPAPDIKLVRPSGYTEVLTPLARSEKTPAKSAAADNGSFQRPAPFPGHADEVSWFLRVLALGVGTLALIAFILGSSVLIGISDPPQIASIPAENRQLRSLLPNSNESAPYDLLPNEDSTADVAELPLIETDRPRLARPRAVLAAYHPRRLTPRPQFVRTDFIPTKLVIYPENGVIKTRIEPQLTAIYIRALTFRD